MCSCSYPLQISIADMNNFVLHYWDFGFILCAWDCSVIEWYKIVIRLKRCQAYCMQSYRNVELCEKF